MEDITARRAWRDLECAEAELPSDGTGRCVEVGGRRYALFRHGERVHVLDDACPHMGASLGDGILSRGEVTCPWHGWHFELGSGCNTDGLEARVAVFPVRIVAGRIQAELPE